MAVLASHRLIGWPVSRKPQRPSLLDSPAVVLDGGAYAAAQARGHSPDWPRSCDASCGGAAGGKNPRWSLAALAAGLTALELQDVLSEKIREYMPSPEVSVLVCDNRFAK